MLATRQGRVKKTRLTEYDSPRTGGLIAINLRATDGDADAGAETELDDDAPVVVAGRDELVGAGLLGSGDDLLLVSRKGLSLRFTATDSALRPMGRATSGVRGMAFREGDELLAMAVVHHVDDAEGTEGSEDDVAADNGRQHVFVVFEGGNAKRTHISEYRVQNRGGLGIKVAASAEKLGNLVGALMVRDGDEVLVVMEKGKIVRSTVDDVGVKGRNTQGVRFAKPDPGDAIIAITRNDETAVDVPGEDEDGADGVPSSEDDSTRGEA